MAPMVGGFLFVLMRGYWEMGSSARFMMLVLASGIPFNAMFLYVLTAPAFLGEHLKLAPGQFFWFFLVTICGIMSGASVSARLAGTSSRSARFAGVHGNGARPDAGAARHGVIVPLVMHSTIWLAAASFLMMAVGLLDLGKPRTH